MPQAEAEPETSSALGTRRDPVLRLAGASKPAGFAVANSPEKLHNFVPKGDGQLPKPESPQASLHLWGDPKQQQQ